MVENSGTKITRRRLSTMSAKSSDIISQNVQILKRKKRRKKKGKEKERKSRRNSRRKRVSCLPRRI